VNFPPSTNQIAQSRASNSIVGDRISDWPFEAPSEEGSASLFAGTCKGRASSGPAANSPVRQCTSNEARFCGRGQRWRSASSSRVASATPSAKPLFVKSLDMLAVAPEFRSPVTPLAHVDPCFTGHCLGVLNLLPKTTLLPYRLATSISRRPEGRAATCCYTTCRHSPSSVFHPRF